MTCRELLMRTRVGEVMQPCSIFVAPGDLVTRARSIMRASGLRTLFVVEDGKLSGIITARQMLRVTSTRSNIPVAGLMFQPRLVATRDDPLSKILKDMLALEISAVPVVKGVGDRTVLGMIRMEDVLARVVNSLAPGLKVKDVMTNKEDVVTCGPEDEVSKVWDLMEKVHHSGLPVVKYDKRKRAVEVIGMLTRSDIIRSGAIRLAEESDKGRFRSPPKVRALMRTPAITVSPETPLVDAVRLLLEKGIGRLPVVKDGSLVGIVSRADVFKACL
jgi:CBS domain-containing protein